MAPSLKELLRQNEFWVFIFVLAAILLNWPMLTLVAGQSILGIPATLVYVTVIWLMIIVILYLFDRGYSD